MLSFANATGNLYNRWGKLGALVKTVKSYQNTLLTAMTDTTTGVVAQYNTESDLQAEMGSSYIGILSATDGTIAALVQQLATDTVNRAVYRDNPQLNQTLTNGNLLTSINEVIRQMKIANATILQATVTATVQAGAVPPSNFIGTGNGFVVVSVNRPFDGRMLENAYAEKLTFTCTADSYTGNATAGNEQFSVSGVGAETDYFGFDWPLGSNASINQTAIYSNVDNTNNNLLVNGSFNNFTVTANLPDSWTFTAGVAGVTVFQENTLTYSGASALRILGDGVTLPSWSQAFGSVAGSLAPLTQYAFNIVLRRDGAAPANGTLVFDWVDQNGVVILDAAGVANSLTVNCATQLSTSYNAFNVAFRTPLILPTTISMRMHFTGTPLTTGRSVYLDFGALGVMQQLYTSGPYVATFSGSIPFIAGDYGYAQITNSRGAGGTLSTWQTLLAQFFPQLVYGSEILFPSSLTPTISDSLIN